MLASGAAHAAPFLVSLRSSPGRTARDSDPCGAAKLLQARVQAMNQVSFQLRPSSLLDCWYQRHDVGVMRSHTPRQITGSPSSPFSIESQMPAPSTKLPQLGGGVSTP